jgi:hypothetical protein
LVARKRSNRKINKFIIGQNLCIGQFCAYTIPYKEAGQIINLDLGDDDE